MRGGKAAIRGRDRKARPLFRFFGMVTVNTGLRILPMNSARLP